MTKMILFVFLGEQRPGWNWIFQNKSMQIQSNYEWDEDPKFKYSAEEAAFEAHETAKKLGIKIVHEMPPMQVPELDGWSAFVKRRQEELEKALPLLD